MIKKGLQKATYTANMPVENLLRRLTKTPPKVESGRLVNSVLYLMGQNTAWENDGKAALLSYLGKERLRFYLGCQARGYCNHARAQAVRLLKTL